MKKISIIGMRGVPVIYGGFEILAEELGTYLSEHNYAVTVYCRNNFVDKKRKKYKKIDLVVLPVLKSNSLETITHSLLSTFHATFLKKPDIILYLGVGSTLFALIPRLFGIKTVVHIDGLDWRREKWNSFGKSFLKISEKLTPYIPNMAITDSYFMEKYYKKQYGKKILNIPYGYIKKKIYTSDYLKKHNLQKNKYIVWVGRFVPDNHLEDLLSSFKKTSTELKCVIIGDGVYKNSYVKGIYNQIAEDGRILHTGFLNREEYSSIVKNSFAYIETKRSGGTHPSLVEAMGFGCFIISNPNPANEFVLGSSAIYYSSNNDKNSLTSIIQEYSKRKHKTLIETLRKRAKQRAQENYDWDVISVKFKNLFDSLVKSSQ